MVAKRADAAKDRETDADAAMGRPRLAEPLLSQDEIDSLLGLAPGEHDLAGRSGVRAIIEAAPVPCELPRLGIAVDRLARLMTTSLRNFTSGNVDVSIEQSASICFGDYLDSIPSPAIVAVFRAEQLDNFGFVTVDSNLIHSAVDVFFGGRRGGPPTRLGGGPTMIERMLVTRMIELVLAATRQAFSPLIEVDFKLHRIETDPRLAVVAGRPDAAIVVKLRIDMEGRGGRLELVLPYSEPIRKMLLRQCMGEKLGRDSIWEGNLASELWAAKLEVRAVLDELKRPLGKVLDLKVGDTLVLDALPNAQVKLKCGAVDLCVGRIGRMDDSLAVRVERPIAPAAQHAVMKLGGGS